VNTALAEAQLAVHGRSVQVDSIKTRIESKAPMISTLKTISETAFSVCLQFQLAPLQCGAEQEEVEAERKAA